MQAVRGVDLGDDGKDAVVRLVQVHPHHAQLLAVAVAPHEPAGPAAARAAEDDALRLLDPRVHLPGEHRPDLRRHRRRLRQRRRRRHQLAQVAEERHALGQPPALVLVPAGPRRPPTQQRDHHHRKHKNDGRRQVVWVTRRRWCAAAV